jgi:hypothetical protein
MSCTGCGTTKPGKRRAPGASLKKPIRVRAHSATEEAEFRSKYAGYAVHRVVLGSNVVLLTFTKA